MATSESSEVFEDGALPKKFKVNGGPDISHRAASPVTFSEADSSNDIGARVNGQLGDVPSWPNEAIASGSDYTDFMEPSTSSGSRGEPLKNMLDCVEQQYVDEKTTKQMADIENEVKQNMPLISDQEDLSVLEEEYSDPVYIQKIMDLKKKYRWLRRTRGDGNCFYRSLGFSIFENFMRAGDNEAVEKFKRFMIECKDALLAMKYSAFTMEDFQDQFNEQLSRVMTAGTEEELLNVFQSQGTSDFIVVWFRFLTVLQLRKEPEFYENFIENHPSVADFCRSEVEPMYRESDHIHIIAIVTLLKMKVRVEYMDRGDSPTVFSHDFPEDDAEPSIFLLYRPGHYDILYKS